MNKQLISGIALLWLGGTSVAVASNPFYIGGKVASVDSAVTGFDNATNLGLLLGYDLDTSEIVGTLSFEAEWTGTASRGAVATGGSWETDTLALFGVYRTPKMFYLKGKAGFLAQNLKTAGATAQRVITDEHGTAFGVGAGWRFDRLSGIEIEYTGTEYTGTAQELRYIGLNYTRRY